MQWLNIHIPDLQSEEFLGSEPVVRATWLSLLSYCANQENGGIIDGASTWSDRMCQQVLGVTKSELHTDTQLFTHADGSVVVWAYPVDQEAAVQAKREGGRIGGLRKAKNRLAKPVAKPQANLQGELLGELLGVIGNTMTTTGIHNTRQLTKASVVVIGGRTCAAVAARTQWVVLCR